MGAHSDTSAPEILQELPGLRIDSDAMDVFVARPHQLGKRLHLLVEVFADEMLHDLNSNVSRQRIEVLAEIGRECECQELILGAEIGLLQAFDILRKLVLVAGTAMIGIDRADARLR